MVRGDREAGEKVRRQVIQLDGRPYPVVALPIVGAVAGGEVTRASDPQEDRICRDLATFDRIDVSGSVAGRDDGVDAGDPDE